MPTPHDLWHGRLDTQVGRLRDWTWTHGREWDQIASDHPTLYDEMRALIDVYADGPSGPSFGPPVER